MEGQSARRRPRWVIPALLVVLGELLLGTMACFSFSQVAPASPPALRSSRLPPASSRRAPLQLLGIQYRGTPMAYGVAASTTAGLVLCWALARRRQCWCKTPGIGAPVGPHSGRRSAARLHALPEAAGLAHQAQEQLAAGGNAVDVSLLSSAVHQWADVPAAELSARTAELAHAVLQPVPPAYAAEAPVLDPSVKYLFGANGQVLVDPMSNKPIPDDWWNGFIGFQAQLIKELDGKLREAGVGEAFGWTIVLYTCLVKLLFYPLQQGQLRSTAMMQLLSPKVKEVQARYKNDPETMQRLIGQLYTSLDVNPLGGCLPVFLQIPIFWSLYGVWRRLSAESFPHYKESWLWVPSLAQPNPDFQFKLDWLSDFKDGAPTMGWHDYLCYLIFPAILVGFTVAQQQQTQAARSKDDQDQQQQLLLQVLPLISVYFIGTLSLELPQAVSVYYFVNTGLSLAQTSLVKYGLRQEIPGYAEFERTGKFPDSAFEEAVIASAPAPKTLHEAALQGNVQALKALYEGDAPQNIDGGRLDIDAWDDKEIAPLGYAVARGHLPAARFFIENGANLQRVDGAGNTMLHYAAGYGHREVLEELFKAGADIWSDDAWQELRNKKGQTVVDVARVNRKGGVMDFLNERFGIEVVTAEVASPRADEKPLELSQARAALLATANGGSEAPAAESSAAQAPASAAAGGTPPAAADSTASAISAAVAKLKQNPEAVDQARKMMSKMPPQMLSMLSGNKMTAEQAKEAMDKMESMSTKEILEKADGAAELLAKATASSGPGGPSTAQARPRAPARTLD